MRITDPNRLLPAHIEHCIQCNFRLDPKHALVCPTCWQNMPVRFHVAWTQACRLTKPHDKHRAKQRILQGVRQYVALQKQAARDIENELEIGQQRIREMEAQTV